MKFPNWAATVIVGTLIFKAYCGKSKCLTLKIYCGPKEGQMVAATGVASAQNTGKCPHGLPVGTCPICSGMGGGASTQRKDKPRVPGEMSYAECMAAWIKIQAAKEAKIEAQIQRLENAQAAHIQHRIIMGLDKVMQKMDAFLQKLDSMPKMFAVSIKIVINVIVKPILNLIAKVSQAINYIQVVFSNIRNFIVSVGEKLASIYGEIKNFVNAKIAQPLKKTIKSILNFFAQGEEEEDEEREKLKSREIKKVLKGLFRLKNKHKRELEESEEDK